MRQRITAKVARREGVNLDGREKIARILEKKPYAPGMHGPVSRRRITDYGKQLREKQMAKLIYGLSERQFRNYFENAKKKKGDTAQHLVQLLEQRLDNMIFRAGFAKTRAAARQLVSHANFNLNGRKVNVPSIQVVPGDIVSVREAKLKSKYWGLWEESASKIETKSWVNADFKNRTIKVLSVPEGDDLKQSFDPKKIIEFYSR